MSFSNDQVTRMVQLYQAGQSIYDIGRELGCAPQTVHKKLVAAGVPRRSKAEGTQLAFEKSGRGAETRQHRVDVQTTKAALVAKRAVAVERYLRGESATAIGRDLGHATTVVCGWLRAAGVELRPLTEACRKHSLNERAFQVIETDAQAYWLGFLTADGGISDQAELRVNLQLRDKPHLERLRAFLGASYEVKEAHVVKPGYERHSAYLDVLSRPLCADLLRHGVAPRKSETCRFNLDLPEYLYSAYVRGLFDGDGGWGGNLRSGRDIQWCLTGNRDFLATAQVKLMALLDLNQTKLTDHHSTDWLARLQYGGTQQVIKISRWMYRDATIFLQRKYDHLCDYLNRACPALPLDLINYRE